jgi:hypothetical protein
MSTECRRSSGGEPTTGGTSRSNIAKNKVNYVYCQLRYMENVVGTPSKSTAHPLLLSNVLVLLPCPLAQREPLATHTTHSGGVLIWVCPCTDTCIQFHFLSVPAQTSVFNGFSVCVISLLPPLCGNTWKYTCGIFAH